MGTTGNCIFLTIAASDSSCNHRQSSGHGTLSMEGVIDASFNALWDWIGVRAYGYNPKHTKASQSFGMMKALANMFQEP